MKCRCPQYDLVQLSPEDFDVMVAEAEDENIVLFGFPYFFCEKSGCRVIWPKPPRGVGVCFEESPEKKAYCYLCQHRDACVFSA